MQQIDNINSTSSHASREEKWDFLRGIAIFLVLLGHSIQWTDPEWQHNLLFEGIYSFHMPLFMFISGYFTKEKPPRSTILGMAKTESKTTFSSQRHQ